MKSHKITSVDDLHFSFKRIRDLREGFITNFYINPFVTSLWIKHELLRKVSLNKTDFLLRKDHNFKHLYYSSVSEDALKKDLFDLVRNYDDIFVADIIGNESSTNSIADLFLLNGFNRYTSLVRMTRRQSMASLSNYNRDDGVKEAQKSDLIYINKLLAKYFDLYSEQFPYIEELENWREKGTILLYKSENIIKGFIIFEYIGYTSYLRYWFVHPDYREQRIGSKLISSFFYRTQKSARQLFWVNSGNDNAIKRYMHYGFLPEDLIDLILINRQIQYGTGSN